MRKELLSGLRRRFLRRMMQNKMLEEKLFSKYIDAIKRRYPRSTIILYGSRSRGEELPYSDYDLAIVLDEISDRFRVVAELRRLKPRGLNIDLIVFGKNELDDQIVKAMLNNGKILYDGLHIYYQE